MKWFKLLLVHAAFLALAVFAALALFGMHCADMEMAAGGSAVFEDIVVRLEFFHESRSPGGALLYASDISIPEKNTTNYFRVMVNRPAVYRGVAFYQKSYSLRFRSLKVEYAGARYDLLARQEFPAVGGGAIALYPALIESNGLLYAYEVYDGSGKKTSSGEFRRNGPIPDVFQKGRLRFLEEDYSVSSTLRAVRLDYAAPLAMASAAFLVFLGLGLWLPLRKKGAPK